MWKSGLATLFFVALFAVPRTVIAGCNPFWVAAGSDTSFVITQRLELVAWGSNGKFQLTDGSPYVFPYMLANPQMLLGGRTSVAAIVSGEYHTLADVDGSQRLSAVGGNGYGQLGDGTLIDRGAFVSILGGAKVRIASAGGEHSLAVMADGSVMAWGSNSTGQLGNGTYTPSFVPTRVGGLTAIVRLSTRHSHCLAVDRAGTVWAWGDNFYGQLGNGSRSVTGVNIPFAIPGIKADNVAAGGAHSAIIDQAPSLRIWTTGEGTNGQLGDGLATSRLTFQPISLTDVSQLACGFNHCIALDRAGTAWTWGYNGFGQVGNGSVGMDELSPLRLLPGVLPPNQGNQLKITGVGGSDDIRFSWVSPREANCIALRTQADRTLLPAGSLVAGCDFTCGLECIYPQGKQAIGNEYFMFSGLSCDGLPGP